MKVFWHKKEKNKQLLLLFNGWGFDWKIFQDVDVPHHDVVSVYDYADIEPEQFGFTKSYPEVKIAAWSYGVFVADYYSETIFNVTKAIAINGSTTPIDDVKGIPVKIFLATMQSFNAANRDKFYLRIAGGLSAYKQIINKLPDREVENQLAELKSLYQLSLKKRENSLKWDVAIISTHDKIFPLANMKNAWGDKIVVVEGEHYPDFNEILLHDTVRNTMYGQGSANRANT
jgi:biotin synthesis protein BioG